MTASPRPFRSTTQLYDVTAMFCDLVGSTELSTVLDGEDFGEAIRSYHDAVADAVEPFGGYVSQLVGDGVLVLFGYPNAHENAAEQAIRASFDVVEAVTGLGLGLQVRIGVHSGPCTVSSLRPGSPQETLALGETLNTASRVQAAAEPGSVLMSEVTGRLVDGWFEVESTGLHTLKGLTDPIELFRVLGPSENRSRLDARGRRGFTRFVGRGPDRDELARRWRSVCAGHSEVVLVSGEAGIGKSRLARVFAEDLDDQPHLWLEGSCSPFTPNTAFRPVIDLVERLLGFTTDVSPHERAERLTRAADRVGLSDETVALVAQLLSLPSDTTLLDGLGPEARRQRTLDGLVGWVRALSGPQPVVLVVEDLHWCDASTLELIRRIGESTSDARLLTLLTARPEFGPSWLTLPNVHVVALSRITDEESGEIVEELVAHAPLSVETCADIVRRADGVPLFLEELTTMLVESAVGRGGPAADVPATLHGSLLARLDRLGPAKEVAQTASVIGRDFSRELLALVCGVSTRSEADALDDALVDLVQAGLVLRGDSPTSFTFKHALVQDVAHQSLLKKSRALKHERVLVALREHFPERLVNEPEVAARHAQSAGLSRDAVALFRAAAAQAIRRTAHEEAISHLRQALAVVAGMSHGADRDRHELALQQELAGSLIHAVGYHHSETMTAWQRAHDLALEIGDHETHGAALLGLAVGTYCAGRLDEAIPIIEQALASALERDNDVHAVVAYNEYAIAMYAMGRFRESLEYANEAIARYDPARHHAAIVALIGDDSGISAIGTAGWALDTAGQFERGIELSNRAVATAEAIGHPFSIAQARLWRVAALDDVALPMAAAEADLLVVYTEEQGLDVWNAPAKMLAGSINTDYEMAMAGVVGASATGLLLFAPSSVHNLADLQLRIGLLDDSLGTVEFGLSISRDTNQKFYDSRLLAVKGDAIAAIADRDRTPERLVEAEQCFREAIAVGRAQEAKAYELLAAVRFGRFLKMQGRNAEAVDLLRPLYDSFPEGFDQPRLVVVAELLADLEQESVAP